MKKNIGTLWASFISGDVEAFLFIYNQYVDSMFCYGIKINPNKDVVKDVIQKKN